MKSDDGSTRHPMESDPVAPASREVAAYQPPRVERLGEIRDLTFGPSPGGGDSLDPGTRKVAGT